MNGQTDERSDVRTSKETNNQTNMDGLTMKIQMI